MCTALSLGGFFGRTLDLERSYEAQLAVTPRNFPIPLRALPGLERHYAMVGTARSREGFPLYFDAVNEWGLAMAALDFPGCAVYRDRLSQADNITPFELIPWVLGQCRTLEEARSLLLGANLTRESFAPHLPLTPMHWLIADRTGAVAAEPLEGGLRVTDDPAGVLTNAPSLESHMTHLAQFMNLSPRSENRLAPELPLSPFCRGLGAVGLPGDLSSPSRFVRAAFHRACSLQYGGAPTLTQCLHLLGSVAVPRGSVVLEDGQSPVTVYTSCCDLRTGDYCLTTYADRRLRGVSLHREELEGNTLRLYEMSTKQDILWLN